MASPGDWCVVSKRPTAEAVGFLVLPHFAGSILGFTLSHAQQKNGGPMASALRLRGKLGYGLVMFILSPGLPVTTL